MGLKLVIVLFAVCTMYVGYGQDHQLNDTQVNQNNNKNVNKIQFKTVIIAEALDYGIKEFKNCLTPLRRVYDGDIVLFVTDNGPDDISKCCKKNSVTTKPLPKGNRYIGYSDVCNNYEWCIVADFRGTFFQSDPFKNIPNGYDLILAQEDLSLTIGNCQYNSDWISSCWGADMLKQFSKHAIVNSGVIMGTPKGFADLKDKILNEMSKTVKHCDCTAGDQGHLNYLVYSGKIKVPYTIQKRGEGIVDAIGYTIPRTSNIAHMYSNGYVLKADGSVLPVIYQYDPYTGLTEGKKIISYSLYGNNPRYTVNAIMNSQLARDIFPGWVMRVYYENVPPIILDKLRSAHVELIDMSKSEVKSRMSWRFLVAADENVARYIIRDIDSRLSEREKAAVDEWIASKKKFHTIRDHPNHSGYGMNGGMWGGTRDAVPNMKYLLLNKQKLNDHYMQDMNFLNTQIWPIAKQSVFQHDAFTCTKFGAKPFPMARVAKQFVGQVCKYWKTEKCHSIG